MARSGHMIAACAVMRSVLTLGCAIALGSCDERSPALVTPPVTTRPKVGTKPTELSSKPAPRSEDSFNVSEISDDAQQVPTASSAGPKPVARLIIDEPTALGPAGQMSADEHGVVMIDRSSRVQVARRATFGAGERRKSQFSVIQGGTNDFFAVARGPLLLRGKAYWISQGRLVRRAFDNSTPVEVLANDARDGTRVVGADLAGAPAHALYVSNPLKEDAPPRAKLWTEGVPTEVVSPEGAGASSIAAASTDDGLFTVAIDARSAMTPMHGRRVHFVSGRPELGPDVVMWVGAASQTLSEVFAGSTPYGVRAFLPIERDVSHFGLVMLELGSEPHLDPKSTWRGYPNGIDLAPVASGAMCGSAFVAYVRPETPSPDAPEVLELAEISAAGLGLPQRVDSARGFSNVSFGAGAKSSVLAYVADLRTFATTLRCAHPR